MEHLDEQSVLSKIEAFSDEERAFRATVLKEKMITYQVQNNRTHTKWLQYINSTALRFNFCAWIFHGYYTNRPINASLLTIEMGCSRKAIDEIVADWYAEGWLTKTPGVNEDKNKFYLLPTTIPLEHHEEWFEWYEQAIIPDRKLAYNNLVLKRQSLDNVKIGHFDTTNTTNLRGIEKNVSSFIVNPKSKRVNRGE